MSIPISTQSVTELLASRFELSKEDAIRLYIAKSTGHIINAGLTTWDYSRDCSRCTEQIRHSSLAQFPDDSDEYLMLMSDLDLFEMTQDEPVTEALWFYLATERDITFNIFKRYL